MNNPLQLAQIFRNPQQFMQRIENDNMIMQNPIAKNTIDMMKKGDSKGLEEMARNLYKERGIDVDDALKQAKSMLGIN